MRARCFVPEVGRRRGRGDRLSRPPALRAELGREIEVHQGQGSIIHARPLGDGQVEIGGRVVEDGSAALGPRE